MTAPITSSKLYHEESACDHIAEYWVKYHGDLKMWRERLPEIVELFDCDISFRVGRIDICGVVDTWEETFGLNGEDFLRLRHEIEGWICSYMAAYGRI